MSDWYQNILDFHNLDNADNPDSLVLGSPATNASIAELEKATGYAMPNEFRQLYLEFDGFGTSRDGETEWFFVPISKLDAHLSEVRDWFQDTHPEIAERFVSFVDWRCGDASGYIFTESGLPEPGIFMFEHERYEFDAEQDWREFLVPVDDTIRTFLTE